MLYSKGWKVSAISSNVLTFTGSVFFFVFFFLSFFDPSLFLLLGLPRLWNAVSFRLSHEKLLGSCSLTWYSSTLCTESVLIQFCAKIRKRTIFHHIFVSLPASHIVTNFVLQVLFTVRTYLFNIKKSLVENREISVWSLLIKFYLNQILTILEWTK